jgi:hypothetical protein
MSQVDGQQETLDHQPSRTMEDFNQPAVGYEQPQESILEELDSIRQSNKLIEVSK